MGKNGPKTQDDGGFHCAVAIGAYRHGNIRVDKSSLNAQRINEWRGPGDNPESGVGGTLHDDHEDSGANKDVYIENWGNEDIFARVRLSEYMELGSGAGLKSVSEIGEAVHNPDNLAVSLIDGADIDKPETWLIHVTEADFQEYWEWTMGGQKYYYPAPESGREDKGYVDQNSPEGLTANSVNSEGAQAKSTPLARVLTMAEWKAEGSPIGDYWVIDTDGWAYWAAPVKPGEATGLLLDSVTLKKTPEKDYYYGVNVEAQMATKDGTVDSDGVKDNYERFGDASQGGWTDDGQTLIGIVTSTDIPDPTPTPLAAATVSNGIQIGDIVYAKPGQTLEISASSIRDNDYLVREIDVKNSLNSPVDHEYYTLTSESRTKTMLVFKENAPTGYKLDLSCIIFGEERINGGGWGWKYIYDRSKSVVVIPADSTGVIKGTDGKIYLSYADDIFREFKADGTLGTVINMLP
jgi:hypothetical protein